MSLIRNVGFLVCLGILFSCETEQPVPEVDVFGGYVLFAAESSNPFDFTDDGIVSTDLKGQIEKVQSSLGTLELFVNQRGTLETEVDIMNIPLLIPSVLTTLPGDIPLVRYASNGYTIEVQFDQATQRFIKFANGSQVNSIELDRGTINEMELLSFIQIEATVVQELYDYSSGEWVTETVTYRYNKVP